MNKIIIRNARRAFKVVEVEQSNSMGGHHTPSKFCIRFLEKENFTNVYVAAVPITLEANHPS